MQARLSRLALVCVILFASLLGACAPGIGVSPTPQPIPRVALMHVGTDHVPPSLGTLVGRLADLGWIDGSHDELVSHLVKDGHVGGPRIELIWRNLEKEQAKDQAAAYVAEHVDVIVAFEDASIAAAQAATARMEHPIPVVHGRRSRLGRGGGVAVQLEKTCVVHGQRIRDDRERWNRHDESRGKAPAS